MSITIDALYFGIVGQLTTFKNHSVHGGLFVIARVADALFRYLLVIPTCLVLTPMSLASISNFNVTSRIKCISIYQILL